MGFESETVSLYQVREQHTNLQVREAVGEQFKGTLVCDRGKSYDARQLDKVKQNKCLAHLFRSVDKVIDKLPPAGQTVGLEIKVIFKEALELWKQYQAARLELGQYRSRGRPLLDRLEHALRDRRLGEANKTLVDGLREQLERGRLLVFLEDPKVEPTNNAAERMLRPAVIDRKVSQGSKSKEGTDTYAALRSAFRTAARRGMDMAKTAIDLAKGINPFTPADFSR